MKNEKALSQLLNV